MTPATPSTFTLRSSSLSGQLSRAIVLWVCGFWLTGAVAVAWYVDTEIAETLDSALVQSANRLLELAAHELDEARSHGGSFSSMASTALSAPSAEGQGVPADTESTPYVQGDYLIYQIVDAAGVLLMRSVDAPAMPLPVPLVPGFAQTGDWRVYTLRHSVHALFIRVADPLKHRRQARNESLLFLLVPLLFILPLLAVLVRSTVRGRMAAVAGVTEQVWQRGGQNLAPVNPQGLPDELQALVVSVNRLLLRLHDALQAERALAANAAHELRTPLTVAQLRLFNALALDLSEAAKGEVSAANNALTQLKRRTEKLLQLSRAESGAALARDRVCLRSLVAAVVQEFESDHANLARLSLCGDLGVCVYGDFDAIAIAVRNLIENSLRYGQGSAVVVEIGAAGEVIVWDGGPGVSAARLDDLVRRHVRLTADSAGFGLGLSIVKTIVERHHGQLSFASPPPGLTQGFEARMGFERA